MKTFHNLSHSATATMLATATKEGSTVYISPSHLRCGDRRTTRYVVSMAPKVTEKMAPCATDCNCQTKRGLVLK